MSSTDSTTGLSQNDSRRRVTRTAIVAGWDGSGNASKVLSDNVGLAQHQIWWTSTGATAGQMTVYVRAAKSTFFVPIGTIDLSKVPNGELLVAALIDDVMFQIAGLAGTFSMDAGINSVGIDFTPTGNRSLVDRRRFQVMDVASGWNGASAITVSAEDHAGFAQHQLVVAGGIGSVKLRARPVGANTFVDLTSDVAAIPAGGALVLFPGMYDAFQLVPVGSLSGSINAQIISVGQEMFLPVTPWQVSVGLGYTPANDANVVHIAGAESITGIKSFANTVGYFGGTGGATGSNASWASLNNINIAVNAEWSTGAWLSQRATVPPMLFGLTSGGAFIVQPATSAAPTAAGQAITFAAPAPFQVTPQGEAVQQLTGTNQWGAYRHVNGTQGVFWRFDGTTFYLMKTASGSPFGQWDATRPFAWNIAGGISSDQAWTFGSSVTANGAIQTNNAFVLNGQGTEGDAFYRYGNSVANQMYISVNSTGFGINRTNSSGSFLSQYITGFNSSGGVGLAGPSSVGGNWSPTNDNVYSLGGPSNRWTIVYATTGTINTSDARDKTAITPLTAAEVAAGKDIIATIGTYQFLDAIQNKGAADARMHTGLTVQGVMAIMTSHGLDPTQYGFICYDSWDAYDTITQMETIDPATEEVIPEVVQHTPAGDKYGFRTDELMFFLARGLDARIAAIEAKVGI